MLLLREKVYAEKECSQGLGVIPSLIGQTKKKDKAVDEDRVPRKCFVTDAHRRENFKE